MNVKVIIFDFDGTIADTIDAIVDITNNFSEEFGYKRTSQEELAKIKNFSSQQIIRQSGISIFKLPLIARKIKAELNKRIRTLKPIPGVKEALIELKSQESKLGIITSNSKENAVAFLESNQLQYLFDFVYSGRTLFGKSKVITHLIKQENFNPEAVVYVGDEVRDIEAARKSKIKVIAVTWGFNSRQVLTQYSPDYVVSDPKELVEVVEFAIHN